MRLINDILEFQKLESGKMEFLIEENDMNKVIEEVEQTMQPLAESKGLDFTIQLDKNLTHVRFDRDKIIQVLTNLVNNAIKFTSKGSVSITTTQWGNVIQVSVKDTGPGIKPEDMSKLFKEFGQLDMSMGRKTGGTGLGLAICRQIINAHRGKIWAESEFGKGTTFHFILPVVERRH